MTTILGSCVAVCIWDPQAEVGGMNRFLLPSGRPASPRFGDSAVALLIGRLLELGAHRSRMSAKVFGGACVLEAFRADEWSLGARNVEMAREQLAAASMPVVGEDVGGDLGRSSCSRADGSSLGPLDRDEGMMDFELERDAIVQTFLANPRRAWP